MKSQMSRTADKLELALKQCEQAHKNLRFVQAHAIKHGQPHLEQGSLDLIDRIAKLTRDLKTLLGILEAQTQSAADRNA